MLRRLWPWIVLGALALVAVVPRYVLRPAEREELPRLVTLPAFRLTDQEGKAFGSRELQGKVWLADFMFTRCPTACPRLTALMKRVRELSPRFDRRLHFVSFTIDPAYDRPPVLLAYARQHRAKRSWSFLTGSYDALEDTILRGFRVSTGREEETGAARGAALPHDQLAQIFHGTHLVLVDRTLRVRGYYGSEDDGIEERIAGDIRTLLMDSRQVQGQHHGDERGEVPSRRRASARRSPTRSRSDLRSRFSGGARGGVEDPPALRVPGLGGRASCRR